MASAALSLVSYENEVVDAAVDGAYPRFRQALNAVSDFKWEEEVHRKLFSLLLLEPGWDGYKGLKPSAAAAMFAMQILHEIMSPLLGIPQIVPTPEGSIQLEWHQSDCDLEINISGIYQFDMWFENHRTNDAPISKELTSRLYDVTSAVKTIIRQSH